MESSSSQQFVNNNLRIENTFNKYQPRAKRIRFFVILFLTICVSFGIYILINNNKQNSKFSSDNNKITNKKSTNSILSINDLLNSKLLVPEISNFDNISLYDIPMGSLYSTERINSFNKNLLIVQTNKMFEYDQINKKIVRQSDRSILDCFNGSVKINNYLYVFCQGYRTKAKRGIYVIDLVQGELIKSYSDHLSKDKGSDIGSPEWYIIPNLVNGRLASKGNILWVSTWNGVFRIDVISDNITFYNIEKLGFSKGCHSYMLYANDVNVWVTPAVSSDCDGGVAMYDEKDKSWRTFKVNVFETNGRSDIDLATIAYSKEFFYLAYKIGSPQPGKPNIRLVTYDPKEDRWEKVIDYYNYEDIRKINPLYLPDAIIVYDGGGSPKTTYYQDRNRNLIDISKELPSYIGISNQINGRYYLFTQNSIFTLAKGEFPKFLKNIFPANSSMNGQKTYLSSDEKHAVLAGNFYGGPGFNGPYYGVNLIDIQNGTVTNLVKGSTSEYRDFSQGIFISTADGVDLKDSSTNKIIFSVNFIKKTLSFPQ